MSCSLEAKMYNQVLNVLYNLFQLINNGDMQNNIERNYRELFDWT